MLNTVPRRPQSDEPITPLTLRVPESVLEPLREIARAEDRPLNAQIVRALREWLAERRKKR